MFMTNKEVAIGFFKAIDDNDFSTAEKLLGPNHHLYSSMSPVPMDAEQHVSLAKGFNDAFTNTLHEMAEILEIGNNVVMRGTWHGTHTGSFNGIPASGKTVHLTFIMILEVENNEIKNQWVELDSMSLMIQIGAMPSPAMSS